MKFIATGEIQPLGFSDDEKRVALQVATESGEPIIIEYPVSDLPELSIIATQMATRSAKRTGLAFEPPRLPVAKWSVGAVPETGDIVLKFEYPIAGAHGFRIDRAAALALHSGLGELLSKRVGAN
jgi:hypothetical protein